MDNKSILAILGLATILAVTIVAVQVTKVEQAKQTALLQALREYNGQINGTWVQNIPDIGAVTAGTISADGKSLTLSFMPGDIAYGRNTRLAYFVIDIDGRVKDIRIDGDRISTAVDVAVSSDSPGVVYTDPEDVKDSVASLASAVSVDRDGDFSMDIPIDTYNIDVNKIYVGLDFKLLSEPGSTVTATKIYDIRVEADKADPEKDEFTLSVLAQYNVTA